MYYGKDALVVTPSRTPKPVSQTAENVVVITAREIEEMHAHTIEEALNLATGVTMESVFHNWGGTFIQGADAAHVTMMLDGVRLNDLSSNLCSAGLIPVQLIERIEIIKGPASSSWGSSLGGVINIITKNPGSSPLGGLVSASYGEHSSRDVRAEASGRTGDFGYYFQAGQISFDDFFPGENAHHNVAYAKFTDAPTDRLNLVLTTAYAREEFGVGVDPTEDIKTDDHVDTLIATFSVNYRFTDASEINFLLKTKRLEQHINQYQLSTGDELNSISEEDRMNGVTLLFSSRHSAHNVTLGSELDWEEMREESESQPLALAYAIDQKRRKGAVFGNDTIVLGLFTVTPGLRYDRLSDNNTFTSPSLGVTYNFTPNTLLRAYAARGFSAPPFTYEYGETELRPNPDIKSEKIHSYQAGFETTAVPFLWIKAGVFKHLIRDAFSFETFSDGTSMVINSEKENIQGVELEARSAPVFNTTLAAGVTVLSAKDQDAGGTIPLRPSETVNIEVKYLNKSIFLAMLTGHYVKWTSPGDDVEPGTNPGLKNSFVWDIHASKPVWTSGKEKTEIFLSVRNLFNQKQYLNFTESLATPMRWTEGGIRIKF
jgi:vitamin B12 transporter